MLKSNDLPEFTPPPQTHTRIDKRVAQFIAIRDKIDEMKEEFKAQLAPFEEAKQKLVGEMLAFLDYTGQKSAKTAVGTVTVVVRPTAVCTDPDLFMDFVREHDLYELLDRRANATACRDYAQEHDGTLPPGVRINAFRTVGVTRS